MALEVNTAIKSPGIFVVAPIGSIDGADRGMLQEKIDSVLKQNPEVIIFDMEHADYINSLGIRILVKTKNAMKQRGGKIAFINFPDGVGSCSQPIPRRTEETVQVQYRLPTHASPLS